MAVTLTTAQYNQIVAAADAMTQTQAYQTPFDADIALRVGRVAAAIGFTRSTGQFQEDIKLRPISTMIRLVAFVGHP